MRTIRANVEFTLRSRFLNRQTVLCSLPAFSLPSSSGPPVLLPSRSLTRQSLLSFISPPSSVHPFLLMLNIHPLSFYLSFTFQTSPPPLSIYPIWNGLLNNTLHWFVYKLPSLRWNNLVSYPCSNMRCFFLLHDFNPLVWIYSLIFILFLSI